MILTYLRSIRLSVEKMIFLMKNKNCYFHKTVHVLNPRDISIDTSGGKVAIGEYSYILCYERFRTKDEIQTLIPSVIIGKRFRATRFLTVQCADSITIGDDVLCASNVFITDYNHGIDASTPSYLDNRLNTKPVHIGDGCWIGNNVIILPGVTIGKKCIVGAGSVVTNDISPYSICVGIPAKEIKKWNHITKTWDRVE